MHPYDMFLRLAEIGRLANLPKVLLEYRQHLHSLGYAQRTRQILGIRMALGEAHARRGVPWKGESDDERMWTPSAPDVYCKWAWWALKGRNVRTARKYAFRALRRRPLSLDCWRVTCCALRGY